MTALAPPKPELPPTVQEIRAWSRIISGAGDSCGGCLDPEFTDAQLEVRITRVCAELHAITGRRFDQTMPGHLVPIAQEAVQLRIEQMGVQESCDYNATANDDAVQNFSAGGYSETRRVTTLAGSAMGIPQLNVHAWLNRDIWLLCTWEMRSYWEDVFQGKTIPWQDTTEADWGNYGGLYPYSWGVGFRSALIDSLFIWGS